MNRNRLNRHRLGWSLMELLVVLAVFSIISGAIVMALLSTQRTWATGSGQALLTASLRRTLDRMSRELASSRSAQVQQPQANGAWVNTTIFRIPQDRNGDGTVLDANGNIAEWSDWIIYRAGLVGNTSCVIREVTPTGIAGTGPTEVLASNLSLMSFRRQAAAPDIMEISVTCYSVTEKGQQMTRTMSTRVKLRN